MKQELIDFLNEKVETYNRPDFIDSDPIQVPHNYAKKEDIEIAGFFASTIAWGNRKMIIKNALRLMELMDNAPHDFVLHHTEKDLIRLQGFVHRTFNDSDLLYFISALQHIYKTYGSLEHIFSRFSEKDSILPAISQFKKVFFELPHLSRTEKHLGDPAKGSAAKRINMFLRWMVRKDDCGVDFGIWDTIKPAQLSCPLDVHSGNVARKLGLLTRKQNDVKALNELDANLRLLDPIDPVKYDFALFGIGVFEG